MCSSDLDAPVLHLRRDAGTGHEPLRHGLLRIRPLGSLAAGAIMNRVGVTWAILLQGAGCFLTAAVFRCFVKVLDRNIRALYGEKEEESEGAISEGKSKSLEAQNI